MPLTGQRSGAWRAPTTMATIAKAPIVVAKIAPAATEPSALESTPTPMTGSEFPAKPAT